jgi:hypothetical protein
VRALYPVSSQLPVYWMVFSRGSSRNEELAELNRSQDTAHTQLLGLQVGGAHCVFIQDNQTTTSHMNAQLPAAASCS